MLSEALNVGSSKIARQQGLAVSFGSQTLVKDIIGIFILFENGMYTGDLVTIGAITDAVEYMSIRSVGLRQHTGACHIIPWPAIASLANFVRGIGSFVANYDVDRSEDSDKVNPTLREAVGGLVQDETIRGMVSLASRISPGLVGLTNQAFTVRVSFTTQPLKQWSGRFALDNMVKKHFDAAGITAPHPTMQVMQNGSGLDAAATIPALPAPE
ncbi:hypothetical protein EGK14_09360 [Erwinia sp. 198]|nr:hypothetical protein EGK14_09360 [Erwinia sp. 198]